MKQSVTKSPGFSHIAEMRWDYGSGVQQYRCFHAKT